MKTIPFELFQKIQDWVNSGDRHAKIGIRSNNDKWDIFIYDFKQYNGFFVTESNMNENWDSLILEQVKRTLEENNAKLREIAAVH